MNKNGKKEHRFFFFIYTKDDERKARIYTKNWVSIVFSRGHIQLSVIYKVKVNKVKVDTVIDLTTN